MRRVLELDALGAGVELLKVGVGISTIEKCWSFEFFVAKFFKKKGLKGGQGLQPASWAPQAVGPAAGIRPQAVFRVF